MSTNSEKTGEKINRVAELENMLKEKGVSLDRIEKMKEAGIESNSLPASGTFGPVDWSGKEPSEGQPDFRHFRMTVVGSTDTISTGNIRMIAPKKSDFTKEELLFLPQRVDPTKLYLQGRSINPALSKLSILHMIDYLEGKNFKAERVDVWSLPVTEKGFTKVEDARNNVSLKSAYVITIVD